MPGHTPEEKAKNAAARSIQPAPDRQGGSAAVKNDAGSQSTIGKWREYLKRPEVVAGLLQFSAQMLQTNPGGFGPAFGTSLAAGLGAAGRVSKLQREQGQERADSAASAAQQGFENRLDERRVATQEERTSILGRPRVGKGDKKLTRQTVWENFFQGDPELGEAVLDPGTLRRLGKGAAAAEGDIDGDVMAAGQAVGMLARDIAEAYLDPQSRSDLKFRLGLSSVGGAVGKTVDPDATGGDEPTPGRSSIVDVPEFKTKGGRGGLVSRESQIESEITKVEEELVALQEQEVKARGRGGKKEAQRVRDREVAELEARIADLKSRLGE